MNNNPYHDPLSVATETDLGRARLRGVQCRGQLIGSQFLPVGDLSVTLDGLLRRRSTGRSQTRWQQLYQIRHVRLVSKYQYARRHQSVR